MLLTHWLWPSKEPTTCRRSRHIFTLMSIKIRYSVAEEKRQHSSWIEHIVAVSLHHFFYMMSGKNFHLIFLFFKLRYSFYSRISHCSPRAPSEITCASYGFHGMILSWSSFNFSDYYQLCYYGLLSCLCPLVFLLPLSWDNFIPYFSLYLFLHCYTCEHIYWILMLWTISTLYSESH